MLHAAWNAILKRSRDPDHAVVGVVAVSAATAILLARTQAALVVTDDNMVPEWRRIFRFQEPL